MAMIIVFLTFYLLHLGQALLLPLVIAAAVAYLISLLSHTISAPQFNGFSLPKPLSSLLAIVIILLSLSFLVRLITVNIKSVLEVAPVYQQNLEALIYKAYQFFGFEEVPNIREFLNQFDFSAFLQAIQLPGFYGVIP